MRVLGILFELLAVEILAAFLPSFLQPFWPQTLNPSFLSTSGRPATLPTTILNMYVRALRGSTEVRRVQSRKGLAFSILKTMKSEEAHFHGSVCDI